MPKIRVCISARKKLETKAASHGRIVHGPSICKLRMKLFEIKEMQRYRTLRLPPLPRPVVRLWDSSVHSLASAFRYV